MDGEGGHDGRIKDLHLKANTARERVQWRGCGVFEKGPDEDGVWPPCRSC